jgi:uncharacterized oxidoreductase
MPRIDAATTEARITEIFSALGVPSADAELVSRELIRAELMGIQSHGLVRVMQYVANIRSGMVRPGAPVQATEADGLLVVVNCGWNLGIVAAHKALEIAIERAQRAGIAAVVTRDCNHVGRLGSYVERAARAGHVCLATVAIPTLGHFVVPWGGAEGRLGTNPFAFGFPTSSDPIVADFATSVIPEGKIRTARMNNASLPPDAVLDADGRVTTDPERFYGPPRGMLLPFGGPVGYKGYAMALLAELLGGALAGVEAAADDRPVNGLFLLVMNPTGFLPDGSTEALADKVVDYMHSARAAPGHDEVLVPGELEFKKLATNMSAGAWIDVDDGIWRLLNETAEEIGVVLESTSDRRVER